MTHVSLFTGIGGLDLAAEATGIRTILQVENDPYALGVLEKHWPEVPRIHDVREVNRESVRESVDVISGGFPCQPFSQAGRRRGSEDDRYLWPEMLRVIQELGPTWVVGENVRGLLSLDDGGEFDRILSDLEATGYEVWPLVYSAHSVGAPHRRDRVFIVAARASLSDSGRNELREQWQRLGEQCQQQRTAQPRDDGEEGTFPDGDSDRLQESGAEQQADRPGQLHEDLAHTDGRGLAVERKSKHREQQSTRRGEPHRRSSRRSGTGPNVANTEERAQRPRLRQNEQAEERRGRLGNGGRTDAVGDAYGGVRRGERLDDQQGEEGPPARGADVPLSGGEGSPIREGEERERAHASITGSSWWSVEPDVGRVAHGVPNRVDRLRALGNAVVPRQAYPIFAAIVAVEAVRDEPEQATLSGGRCGGQ